MQNTKTDLSLYFCAGDDMVQIRGTREAEGMDSALSMARDLYIAADAAVRQGYGSAEEKREVEALADIRCGVLVQLEHIRNATC